MHNPVLHFVSQRVASTFNQGLGQDRRRLANPARLSLHAPVLQDTCLAETKSKALEDAMTVRQELQDQYQQQEQVALQVGRQCNSQQDIHIL